jgi:hypothetical protein
VSQNYDKKVRTSYSNSKKNDVKPVHQEMMKGIENRGVRGQK